MKINAVKIYLTQVGGRHPIFVKLFTDEGICGTGEAGLAYGVGGTAVTGMIKDLALRFLPEIDPFSIEAFWANINDFAFWSKGGGPIFFAGVSAIEQALWDIKGKALGVPVYELLGGKVRDKVRVYSNGWTLTADTPDDFARRAEVALKDGYTALKMYPFSFPVPDSPHNLFEIPGLRTVGREFEDIAVARVKAVRDAVGPDVDLMVDLSTLLTPDAVVHFGKRVEACDLFWLEEPAEPADVGSLQKISAHLDMPIATGERLYTRSGFRQTIEAQAADILQPDIGNTGGLWETKKIAAMGEVFGMRIAPHNVASPFSTAMALHLDANLPNFVVQEMFGYLVPEHYDVVDHAPEKDMKDGYLPVSDRPGLGVELQEKWVEQYLWAKLEL